MKIKPFKLERCFAKYEFSAPYLLSCSDCEPLNLKELFALGDKESQALWEKLKLGYTESQGHPLLREEIAKLYSSIKPEEVLIITPEEGIFIAMNVILNKGSHVIVTYPGYQSLYELAYSLGCEVTKWLPEKDKGWRFDLNFLKLAIKSKTKLIVINFPHNPTGFLPSKKDFQEILRIAKKKNIIVFSDEMYRYLEYNEKDKLESACDLYENAVSLFGVSKTFALAGLRIGWLTTKNKKLFQDFATFKDYTTICSSAPSEILALMALRVKDKIINRNLGIIKSNLALLDRFFEKYPDVFEWPKPKAGSIAFPALVLPKKVSDFCLDLVNKKEVMLLPAEIFDYEGNDFRVGFGRKNMPEALAKLEEYLKECI